MVKKNGNKHQILTISNLSCSNIAIKAGLEANTVGLTPTVHKEAVSVMPAKAGIQ
jgi:hypothetical protein